jgi:CBS-domain-containing membrane protein
MRMDRAFLAIIIAGALGGAAAVGLMEAASDYSAFPLSYIPFATSIVVVMGSPEAPPAQPRALIGGHLISTVIGLSVVKLLADAGRRRRHCARALRLRLARRRALAARWPHHAHEAAGLRAASCTR